MATTVLLAASVTVAGLVVGPVAVAGSAPMCQGKEATIVATHGQRQVLGTDGPDVIVVANRNLNVTVKALDGDDTVCVIEGRVAAGPGNDAVLAATPANGITWVDLGPGDDSFV